MTYKELAQEIGEMSIEQQDCDVTVYFIDPDEYFQADLVFSNESCDVLDPGHPVLRAIDSVIGKQS